MVEVLAAGLTGANWSFQASSLGDDLGGPPRLGQTFIAIDPAALTPGFADRLGVMLTAMTDQPGVRLPGDRRHKNRKTHMEDGVTLALTEVETLATLTGQPV